MSDVWCLVYYCDCDFVAMDVIVTAIHRSPLILPSNCLPVDSPTFHSSIHSYVHPSLPEPMYPPALPSIQPTHLSPRPVPFLVFLCLASSISSFSLLHLGSSFILLVLILIDITLFFYLFLSYCSLCVRVCVCVFVDGEDGVGLDFMGWVISVWVV